MQQCSSYDYSVTLGTPFPVTAGTRYWLLIQAESSLTAQSNAGWEWHKGLADNLFSIPDTASTVLLFDFAFALRP